MDQQAELADIKKAIIDLDKRFTDSALQIVEVSSGYRLQIKNEYSRLLYQCGRIIRAKLQKH